MKTLIIIPSRLSATRLPGKPLLKINGLSIISHVFKKAEEANIGEVVVATEDLEIIEDVKKNGGQAILTEKNHKTGTDRIYEALQKFDNKNIDLIMSPAVGGIVIGYEIGRILNIETIFAERVDGKFTLRRGFEIKKGQRVLIVEDVITTGK